MKGDYTCTWLRSGSGCLGSYENLGWFWVREVKQSLRLHEVALGFSYVNLFTQSTICNTLISGDVTLKMESLTVEIRVETINIFN